MAEDNQANNQNQNGDVTMEKLQEDLSQAINGWKRTAADFENFKKHKERENKELLEFAKEVVVVKLLPIIDSLEQALRHMPGMNHESPVPSGTPVAGQDPLRGAAGQAGIMNQEWEKKYGNWQAGVNGIVAQLDKALGELGVRKIETVGKKFDPHFHEAVKEIESEADDGVIIDELQSGFILNGKVIRPSQVIISKRV